MERGLKAVFRGVPAGYIGFVDRLLGANTQGATLQEASANLREAVALVREAHRERRQQKGRAAKKRPDGGQASGRE